MPQGLGWDAFPQLVNRGQQMSTKKSWFDSEPPRCRDLKGFPHCGRTGIPTLASRMPVGEVTNCPPSPTTEGTYRRVLICLTGRWPQKTVCPLATSFSVIKIITRDPDLSPISLSASLPQSGFSTFSTQAWGSVCICLLLPKVLIWHLAPSPWRTQTVEDFLLQPQGAWWGAVV